MNYLCAEKSFDLSAGSHFSKTHLKPSGAVGCFVGVDQLEVFSFCVLSDVNTSIAALMRPIADKAISPQKINIGTCINSTSFLGSSRHCECFS